MTDSRYAMIMAGGVGTRLWPMSRRDQPKQLLPLIGGRSLLELAARRLEGIVPPERRLICTAETYRTAVRSVLPAFTDDRILGEPVGRNTVNAVGFTAAVLAARDPGAIFAVLTADHVIEPQAEFGRRLDVGFALVEADPSRFVTFSIRPGYAATGYGYVERGAAIDGFDQAYTAQGFVEKPDAATAQRYVEAGTFGWNSGMFVFQATAFMDALARFVPASAEGLRTIATAWGTPDQAATLARVYPELPPASVDCGVMEPAADDDAIQVCCVPMDVSWMDVGSWPSYGKTLAADDAGCRTNTRTIHVESTNVLAVSDDPTHTITTVGCRDLVIVHTTDATMVCPASDAQRVREIADAACEDLQ